VVAEEHGLHRLVLRLREETAEVVTVTGMMLILQQVLQIQVVEEGHLDPTTAIPLVDPVVQEL
jgi:hypothetical protein